MMDGLAHCLEQGPRFIDIGVFSTDEEKELSLFGRALRASDRRIEEPDISLRCL
jgi:hypothetical protein